MRALPKSHCWEPTDRRPPTTEVIRVVTKAWIARDDIRRNDRDVLVLIDVVIHERSIVVEKRQEAEGIGRRKLRCHWIARCVACANAQRRLGCFINEAKHATIIILIGVLHPRRAYLLEVAQRSCLARGLTRLRKTDAHQREQDSDDRNDHKQFDDGEASARQTRRWVHG